VSAPVTFTGTPLIPPASLIIFAAYWAPHRAGVPANATGPVSTLSMGISHSVTATGSAVLAAVVSVLGAALVVVLPAAVVVIACVVVVSSVPLPQPVAIRIARTKTATSTTTTLAPTRFFLFETMYPPFSTTPRVRG
jgi:hypothetical protein